MPGVGLPGGAYGCGCGFTAAECKAVTCYRVEVSAKVDFREVGVLPALAVRPCTAGIRGLPEYGLVLPVDFREERVLTFCVARPWSVVMHWQCTHCTGPPVRRWCRYCCSAQECCTAARGWGKQLWRWPLTCGRALGAEGMSAVSCWAQVGARAHLQLQCRPAPPFLRIPSLLTHKHTHPPHPSHAPQNAVPPDPACCPCAFIPAPPD